jgi:hypothetical protein
MSSVGYTNKQEDGAYLQNLDTHTKFVRLGKDTGPD